MTKTRTVRKLEDIIRALKDSRGVIEHNVVEQDYVNDLIIKYQTEYKHITGRYYSTRIVKHL